MATETNIDFAIKLLTCSPKQLTPEILHNMRNMVYV